MRFPPLALFCTIVFLLTPKAFAWDWEVHYQIAVAAGVTRGAAHGIAFPDMLRKLDPKESPRHYMNADFFPAGYALGGLPITYETFAAQVTQPDKMGFLLYEILYYLDQYRTELTNRKKADFSETQLRLAHYVADLFMPLHLTRNHDGADTGQNGVHERVEDYADKVVTVLKGTHPLQFKSDAELWVALQEEAAISRQESLVLLAIDKKSLACKRYEDCFKEARPVLQKRIQRAADFLTGVLAYAAATSQPANAHYEHRH
jgi:hypothetical protein